MTVASLLLTRSVDPMNTDKPRHSLLDFGNLKALSNDSEGVRWFVIRHTENGENQHRTKITGSVFTVGRKSDRDFCLSDGTVSGCHGEFRIQNENLVLHDSASTNGTLVNGVRIYNPTELKDGDIVYFGQAAFTIQRCEKQKSGNEHTGAKTMFAAAPEDAVLCKGFDRLINRPDIDPFFQPIIRYSDGSSIGYEVLVRSKVKGLEFPDRIFRIAAMRKSEARLSEVCRSEGLLSGVRLDPNGRYFLNTHAAELETERLIGSLRDLRADYPNISIVLEIHEAAITSIKYLVELSSVLRELNIELAYDDFGAGQARLIELFEVPPRYLKFDLSFVRGLENASKLHRASVRSLINMVHDLDVVALAEGVETPDQSEICQELGFDLAQGYLYGRPQPRQFWAEQPISAPTIEFNALPVDTANGDCSFK